jgi:hypothetical protein
VQNQFAFIRTGRSPGVAPGDRSYHLIGREADEAAITRRRTNKADGKRGHVARRPSHEHRRGVRHLAPVSLTTGRAGPEHPARQTSAVIGPILLCLEPPPLGDEEHGTTDAHRFTQIRNGHQSVRSYLCASVVHLSFPSIQRGSRQSRPIPVLLPVCFPFCFCPDPFDSATALILTAPA